MTGTCIPGAPIYSIFGYESWNMNTANIEQNNAGRERWGPCAMGRENGKNKKSTHPKTMRWPEHREQSPYWRALRATIRSVWGGGGEKNSPPRNVMWGCGPAGHRATRRAVNAREQSGLTSHNTHVKDIPSQPHYEVSVGIFPGKVRGGEDSDTPRNSTRIQRPPRAGTLEG